MAQVATILAKLDCKLSMVDIPALGLPAKGDAWDWARACENATHEALEALASYDVPAAEHSAPEADFGLRVLLPLIF